MVKETVCVIGLGYIGLPTAALLASQGYQVVGVDVNAAVVDVINRGEVHIVEPDLDAFVRSAVTSGRLRATLVAEPADVFMICVPTPFRDAPGDPIPDISFVEHGARAIAPRLRPGNIVILESTSPIGTTERVAEIFAEAGVDLTDIAIAYCPERVLPGRIMIELTDNARVVGGLDPAASRRVAEFYRKFVKGEVLETTARTAEMCKLAENSYRDVNIAFANELSLLGAKLGVDSQEVIALANRHPRVNILQPGVGVGGHCIAVDPWFLVAAAPDTARLIRGARQVNLAKTEWVIEQIVQAAAAKSAGLGRPARIACLGATFKPDIDDLRESPALEIAHALKARGHDLVVVEPHVEAIEGFALTSLESALESSEVVAVLVRHQAFLAPGVRETLGGHGALDFCGL